MSTKIAIKVKTESSSTSMSVGDLSIEKKVEVFKNLLLGGPFEIPSDLLEYICMAGKMSGLIPITSSSSSSSSTAKPLPSKEEIGKVKTASSEEKPLKPKTKALTGYNLYMKETGVSATGMGEVAKLWKALSAEEKKVWGDKAKALEPVIVKETTGPKGKTGPKSKTCWHKFLAEQMAEMTKGGGKGDMGVVSAKWKAMSAEEKEAYKTK